MNDKLAAVRPKLVRLARHYGAGSDQAQDIAQDVLLMIWRKPHALEPEHEGLLVNMVKYRTLTVLRSERRYARRFTSLEELEYSVTESLSDLDDFGLDDVEG